MSDKKRKALESAIDALNKAFKDAFGLDKFKPLFSGKEWDEIRGFSYDDYIKANPIFVDVDLASGCDHTGKVFVDAVSKAASDAIIKSIDDLIDPIVISKPSCNGRDVIKAVLDEAHDSFVGKGEIFRKYVASTTQLNDCNKRIQSQRKELKRLNDLNKRAGIEIKSFSERNKQLEKLRVELLGFNNNQAKVIAKQRKKIKSLKKQTLKAPKYQRDFVRYLDQLNQAETITEKISKPTCVAFDDPMADAERIKQLEREQDDLIQVNKTAINYVEAITKLFNHVGGGE